ncbi:glycosyltransferase family 2 protein [Furfurilactobacillus curtus]|uniref:Glycosyl transferase n=1 Tax=Furfurilactobacillus curtus TaxID=1746200 RepID=A0ABQ5JQC3_9LACO
MTTPKKELISIVLPVFNEEALIMNTIRMVNAFIKKRAEAYEIIFVDDGSTDHTAEKIRKAMTFHQEMRLIRFSRNFGHQLAITAGVRYANGDAVVVMDADLQDPPEVIGQMIDVWHHGADVVYGQRAQREGESWFKRLTAKAFYRILHQLTSIEIPIDTGDFRLMDRKVVSVLNRMNEQSPFVRGMVSWVGFKQVSVTYTRRPRQAGESKYPLSKMIRLALDGITSFSALPLKFANWAGGGLLFIAAGLTLSGTWGTVSNTQWLLVVDLLIGSLLLFSIGILGQYLSRIFEQSRARPRYVVEDTVGFPAIPKQRFVTHSAHVSQLPERHQYSSHS